MRTFGKFLRERRDAAGLSAEQVVRRLQRYHVRLDNSTLYNYEAGTVSAPDAGVLWALCQIYPDLEIDKLIAFLVHIRSGLPAARYAVATSETTSAPSALDDDEWKLVRTFRGLPAAGKRAALDFVAFEAGRGTLERDHPARRNRFRDGGGEHNQTSRKSDRAG